MPRNSSIDSLAAASARQAQSEMAMMQRDLRSLRDKISGHSAKVPVIRLPRHTIKKTTTSSPWAGVAGIGLGMLVDAGFFPDQDIKVGGSVSVGGVSFSQSSSSTGGNGGDGGGFYASAAQSAGSALGAIALGQRIR